MVRVESIISIARFELLRESSKKTIWFVITLMVLPLIISIIIKSYSRNTVQDPMLWSTIMGYSITNTSLSYLGAGVLSVISWGWLIAILFGGDLLASDFIDGTLALILVRPVSRLEYVIGKVASAIATMILVFLAGGMSVYLAAWVLGGPQEGLFEVVLLSILLGVGAMPLLLLSAWLGMRFRKPLIGYVLGFVAYFASSIAIGLVSVYYIIVGGGAEVAVRTLNLLRAYAPLSDISYLSSTVFARLHPEAITPITIGSTSVQLSQASYLPHAIVGVSLWIILLVLLSWNSIRKSDI